MEIQRESIFVSALRGFCRTFFILLGGFAAFFIVVLVYSALSSPYNEQAQTELELLPDLEWKREPVSLTAPAILQINIHGLVGDPEALTGNTIQSILVDSRTGLLTNNRVKGILLHIDTPGGSAVEADNVYRLLLAYKEKFKVPVFGYIDGLCASGGMYIASSADKLFCSPQGIVGSVGVVLGPFFNVSDAIGRIGVASKTLTEGLDKDMMNPFRAWKADEDASLKAAIATCYQQFVDIVVQARPMMDRDKLINDYGAKIFDGSAALERGYVDAANSSYADALSALMKQAGVDSTKPYQIVQLKPQRHFLHDLFSGKSPLVSGKIEHQLLIGSDRSFVLRDRFAYLYQP